MWWVVVAIPACGYQQLPRLDVNLDAIADSRFGKQSGIRLWSQRVPCNQRFKPIEPQSQPGAFESRMAGHQNTASCKCTAKSSLLS